MAEQQMVSSTSDSTSSGTSGDHYVQSWEKTFPWVYYDPSRRAMLCRTCVKHKKNNVFTNSGCCKFQKTTLGRHSKSREHIDAVRKEAASTSSVSLSTMIRQGIELKKEAVVCAMRNVYWIATEEIALLKYQSLNELMKMQGCAVTTELNMAKNAQYSSYQIAEEMLEAISLWIEQTVDTTLSTLQSSPFIGVMVDESTDNTTESTMIVYAKTFCDGEVTNHFLESIRIEEKVTGEHLYKELSSFLETKGITLNKVSGLRTDGARAMTGLQQGLTRYMKKSNPFNVPIHCI